MSWNGVKVGGVGFAGRLEALQEVHEKIDQRTEESQAKARHA